jgi:hypothetical protein
MTVYFPQILLDHPAGGYVSHRMPEDAEVEIHDFHAAESLAPPPISDDTAVDILNSMVHSVRMCIKCSAKETPQWRRGPFGGNKHLLCNACGLKFSKYNTLDFESLKTRSHSYDMSDIKQCR